MAVSKLLIASLVISLFLLHFAEADQMGKSNPPSGSSPQKMHCGSACSARCQLSSRPNLCNRACGTCSNRCNCVPPGTAGNYDACPCYASMTTRGGVRKCP